MRYWSMPKQLKKKHGANWSYAELVVVGTFLNKMEAEIARGALETADIRSIVSADDSGGLWPNLLDGWMSRQLATRSATRHTCNLHLN